MRRIWMALTLILAVWTAASAETVVLRAERDATLIENETGALALGSAPVLFFGSTAQGPGAAIRRAAVWFDVASVLPRNAVVERATLTVAVLPGNPGPQTVRLHRILADWGEGASTGFGGRGAPAEPGDATWIHRRYDDDTWVRPGGQFVPRASARLEIGDPGFYTFDSTTKMTRDVRMWAANPEHNDGWMLIGDEATPQSVQVAASGDHPVVDLRPTLTIEYRTPGDRRAR